MDMHMKSFGDCECDCVCHKNVKNILKLSLSDYRSALSALKLVFGWGSTPYPARGAYDTP